MTAPSNPTPATLDAAVEAFQIAYNGLEITEGPITYVTPWVDHDHQDQAVRAGLAAAAPILAAAERERIEREIFPLVMATRVSLSKGCMCDYYYGTDSCTGRSDCWTPMAWTLNPADVRAAIARAGTSGDAT